jgi:purine nucleosidase
MGRTIVDWWGVTGQPANVEVVTAINAAGFYQLLTQRLASLSAKVESSTPG